MKPFFYSACSLLSENGQEKKAFLTSISGFSGNVFFFPSPLIKNSKQKVSKTRNGKWNWLWAHAVKMLCLFMGCLFRVSKRYTCILHVVVAHSANTIFCSVMKKALWMLRHDTGNLFLSKGIKIAFSKRMYLVKIPVYIHVCECKLI